VTLQVPAFVVISGGEVGAVYVRQLLRAVAQSRIATARITIVDRDPACDAARFVRDGTPRVELQVADWSEWLDAHLEAAGADSHLVPYHWAPHLLLGWLERQLQRIGATTTRGGAQPPRGLPYEGDTSTGDRALSYAAWMCPPLCIEPALCPHTRGPRDWSLAADLAAPASDGMDDRVVLRCLHLAYGVGTIPIADILSARDRMRAGMRPARYLVSTSSHCHALATALRVD
jgi:hypothetical protein